jgi:hypothetical protein
MNSSCAHCPDWIRPSGAVSSIFYAFPGLTLHPSDEDLSVGTPVLGYSCRLPSGGAQGRPAWGVRGIRLGSEKPSCDWPDP